MMIFSGLNESEIESVAKKYVFAVDLVFTKQQATELMTEYFGSAFEIRMPNKIFCDNVKMDLDEMYRLLYLGYETGIRFALEKYGDQSLPDDPEKVADLMGDFEYLFDLLSSPFKNFQPYLKTLASTPYLYKWHSIFMYIDAYMLPMVYTLIELGCIYGMYLLEEEKGDNYITGESDALQTYNKMRVEVYRLPFDEPLE